MLTEVSIHLYGKPAWDLEIEVEFNAEKIINMGKYLNEWLPKVVEIGKKLIDNGWEYYGGLYDVNFTKNITKEETKEELKKLNVDLDCVNINEEEFEDEEESEDDENIKEEINV